MSFTISTSNPQSQRIIRANREMWQALHSISEAADVIAQLTDEQINTLVQFLNPDGTPAAAATLRNTLSAIKTTVTTDVNIQNFLTLLVW